MSAACGSNAEKVHSMMQRPLIQAKQVGIVPSTIYRVLEKLEVHGIIRQHTQCERNWLYTYSAYQGMLDG
jgi:Fe2+ or Zn2+ uptake regulation protein